MEPVISTDFEVEIPLREVMRLLGRRGGAGGGPGGLREGAAAREEHIERNITGAIEIYPHETITYLRQKGLNLAVIPASIIARDLGDGRMANVVMIGALSHLLTIPETAWQKALRVRLPARFLEGNLKAFAAGREAIIAEGVST